MSLDNALKSLRRVLHLFDHGEFYITVSDYIGVGFIFLVAFLCSSLLFEPWLIKEYLFAHYDSLSWHKHLQQCRDLRVPIFSCISSPSSQQTQTNLTTAIQIWIKAYLSSSSRTKIHLRWTIRVIIVEVYVKYKCTISIRSPFSSHYHCFKDISSFLIGSTEYGICMFYGEGCWHICKFLGQSNQLRLWGCIISLKRWWIVMLITITLFHRDIIKSQIIEQQSIGFR